LIFYQIGLSLVIKQKFKDIPFLFIIISLYLPDLLLLSLWLYDLIIWISGSYSLLINYHLISHSVLIWCIISSFILLIFIFNKKLKIGILFIFCIFVHLGMDILRPTFNFVYFSMYRMISPYHFVNLLYPFIIPEIELAIYIPEFVIWIIDFGILLLEIFYVISKIANE